ncbi:MAG: acetylglutamate kinase [Candidatus Gracilibacteria bacterium]|jgi:acetylglutamate kinase
MNYTKKKLYLSKFKRKIFVLKIGGEVVQEKIILEKILKDIKELINYGIKVVLVHGGGKQADVLAHQIGHKPVKVNGRRVTSEKDLEIAKMLYGGSLNLEILVLMKKLKMKGIRVSGLDGNLLSVCLRDKHPFDFGYVGDIKKVNPKIIKDLLKEKYMPVVSPLAGTSDGVIVNINADTIATELAIALKAEKLILFTAVDGIYHGKKLLNFLTLEESKKAISDGYVKDGMAVKLTNCMRAVEGGVKRVHVINGLYPHSLLGEVLTKQGIGTMIISDKEKYAYSNE